MNKPLDAAPGPQPPPVPAQPGAGDPALESFLAEVKARFELTDVSTFWPLEDAFRRLVESGFASRHINRELTRIVADPSYLGDWRPGQIVIHRGPGFALAIRFLESRSQYIHTTPFLGMYSPIGKDSLHYDAYSLPETGYRNDVFDPGVRLEPEGRGITGPGGILLLESARCVYDFRTPRPIPVLSFVTAPFQTLEWLFARDSLHAWQANDAERSCTQLRVAAYVLGRLSNPSSIDALSSIVDHGHHSVRWAAMENLGRISRRAALAAINKAATDPHPHVRRAATATLRQIGEIE